MTESCQSRRLSMLVCCVLIALIFAHDVAAEASENAAKKPSTGSVSKIWSQINLPPGHMPYFFHSNKRLRKRCLADESCPFKEQANNTKCWGYELECKADDRLFLVDCPGDSRGWTHNKQEQIDMFWRQGDYGYVKERLTELRTYCRAEEPGDSSLECVDHVRMCRAKNIYFDFTDLKSSTSNDRYREDIFKPGQVGGHCRFDADEFRKQGDHKSPLQSWYSELQLFEAFDKRPVDDKMCDIVVKEPTYIIKLDAGVNMYHHFCDFVNLYVSQHFNNSFMQNVNIVFWDTSSGEYWSFFSDMWKVFSNKAPIHLKTYDKKKVCFKDAVFSFLARMRFGLYYNMPLVYGCEGTGLFRSFSEHVLHRFKIQQHGPLKEKLRVTMLARGTQFRNILNQDQIVKELKRKLGKEIELKLVTYDLSTPFTQQVATTHNSDIFMSMHGAGLTHMLFLPHWAAVFEIYNCEDRDCYADLARLRGVKYFTWENEAKVTPEDEGKHPQLGTPHKKFTNYTFDVAEFVRLVKKMISYVRAHPDFVRAHRAKFGASEPETEAKIEL